MNETLLVFAFNKNTKWIKSKLQQISSKFSEIIIICENSNIEVFSEHENYTVKSITDLINANLYTNRDKFLNKNINRFSKNILSASFFEENFIIDGINTWWFIAPNLLNFLKKENIFEIIYTINKLIKENKPRLVLVDSNLTKSNLIKKICKYKSIKFKSSIALKTIIKNNIYEMLVKLLGGMKRQYNARQLAKWAQSTIDNNTFSDNKNNILFISQERANRINYTLDGKLIKHDIYTHNIQTLLKKMDKYNIYSIELIRKTNEIKIYEKLRNEYRKSKRLPLYYFLDSSLNRKLYRYQHKIGSRLRKLFRDENLKNAFTIDNISLIDLFGFYIWKLFITYITKGLEFYYLYLRTFSKLQPKAFVHYNEHSLFGIAAILAAKKSNIPSIALQHGNISYASNGYMYSKDLICDNESNDLAKQCRHISSITSVYGDKIKDFLVREAGYPKDRVIVTGCPRWDVISNNKLFKRNQFLKKLKLNPKKKVVTIFSQQLVKKEDRLYFNNEVLKTLESDFNEIEIIWKPHPRESENEIKPLIKKHGLSKIHLEKDLTLFEVLNASELIITVHSTVGLEAMLFGKPVITLIPPGEEESDLFKDTGATIKVKNSKELTKILDQVLHDKTTQQNIKNNQDKLINKLVRFDGNASKRNAELIIE